MYGKVAITLIVDAIPATGIRAQTSAQRRDPSGSIEVGVEAMMASRLRDMPAPVPLATNLIAGAPATQT